MFCSSNGLVLATSVGARATLRSAPHQPSEKFSTNVSAKQNPEGRLLYDYKLCSVGIFTDKLILR